MYGISEIVDSIESALNNKQEIERIAIELMIAIMETKNSVSVFSEAIEFSSQQGNDYLAKKIAAVKNRIDEGDTILESFYFVGMIQEETYRGFRVIEQFGSLTPKILKGHLENMTVKSTMIKNARSAMVVPLIFVVAASMTGGYLIKTFFPFAQGMYEGKVPPDFFRYYEPMAAHPWLTGIAFSLFFGSLSFAVLYFLFRRMGAKDIEIFTSAATISSLRENSVPYSKIFSELEAVQSFKDLREAMIMVSESAKIETISRAIRPFAAMLPMGEAVVLINKLSANEDIGGWEFVKVESRERVERKLKTLADVLPNIVYPFILLIILVSLYPVGVGMSIMMEKLGGG